MTKLKSLEEANEVSAVRLVSKRRKRGSATVQIATSEFVIDEYYGRRLPPPKNKSNVHCWRMTPTIEKISAITFRVLNMKASVQFYRKVLGMELIYGGEHANFCSLRASNSGSAILNLELGVAVPQWGRLIFHVSDVDALWTHLREKGFDPEIPRDASWGERYFHMLDPDGHELSFARPLQGHG